MLHSKEDIVQNWLPRYTGMSLDHFGSYILLTNFEDYLEMFADMMETEIVGEGHPMKCVTKDDITMINFTMVSPNAATIMDLLSAVMPKAVLFLGKCGGLKNNIGLGELILPIAAIRGEGTSDDYFPKEVPALPSFNMEKIISTVIRKYKKDYRTGIVYSTNRRVWEHDEQFKNYLRQIRATAVDMETATLFTVGFYNRIPTGALLMISDQPMLPDGVKTDRSDKEVTKKFSRRHLLIGIESLRHIIRTGITVKHLRYDYDE